MTHVEGRAYGQRPKLTAESLDRLPRVAVRVLEAGAFEKKGEFQHFVYWISTVEPHDHILFLTAADLREMVTMRGDETEGWKGVRVVLELVNRSYNGKPYEKYVVAPADEWNDVIRPLDAPPASARRKAKKPARKPGKKRGAKRAN